MKPIDHPEFFRSPPPPGQSRESTIVLDAEGRFWHAGELVTHPGMQEAFASWIRRHPDDGRYVLCNGYDWSYFAVEDVPLFVRGVRADPDGLNVILSDGSEESIAAATLRVGPREALYLRVKRGEIEARFTPSAQAALWPFVVESATGAPALRINGQELEIPSMTNP